jgi:hypothetical protein
LLIRRPSAPPALLLADRPTMALDTPPMVVAMPHQDRKVRSLAAGREAAWAWVGVGVVVGWARVPRGKITLPGGLAPSRHPPK